MSLKTILVIEDDAAISEYLQMALTDEGYAVSRAQDGLLGLALAQQVQPVLILLDIRLPNMDGIAFLDAYHKLPPPHAPVIVITAGRSTEEDFATLNIAKFLSKPFDLDDLLGVVKTFVR
jgi:DNA-binding response OmpR family regulator